MQNHATSDLPRTVRSHRQPAYTSPDRQKHYATANEDSQLPTTQRQFAVFIDARPVGQLSLQAIQASMETEGREQPPMRLSIPPRPLPVPIDTRHARNGTALDLGNAYSASTFRLARARLAPLDAWLENR